MTRFCVVVSTKGREVSRSKPMVFEDALKLLRARTKKVKPNLLYIEDASAVKHLPIKPI